MRQETLICRQDHAQGFLLPYLRETERLFLSALSSLDSSARCRITPAADLCIPHDVIRLVGGFATGVLVEWKCDAPAIPVDTCLNIDTTSIFYLNHDLGAGFCRERLSEIQKAIEEQSSYEWNLHKGNHFISACKRLSDGRPAIVIHSNEKEFKFQFNGLIPTYENWFFSDLHTAGRPDRPLRLLIGKKATLFERMATMLEPYNIIRHSFIAELLCGKEVRFEEEYHKHHYFMPYSGVIAMGCYLCDPGETVPILSRPGRNIDFFRPERGGKNDLTLLNGKKTLLVPHGWGKTSREPISMEIESGSLIFNGLSFRIAPQVSLGKHPLLVTRDFSDNIADPDSFQNQIAPTCPGRVVDSLKQLAWFNKDGFTRPDDTGTFG